MTTNSPLTWQYNEFQQVGTDYSSQAEVESYDAIHADFRDIAAESQKVLDTLALQASNAVIDFGAGTGTFALYAAQRCAKVYAVDVSQPMLDYAQAKASQTAVTNIEFHHAGFLTYAHNAPPVDAIVTTFALHHLPDFWKGIALKRLYGMLKAGGQLYLHDVILEEANALDNITALIDQLAVAGGQVLQEDTEKHFKEENSTYDWVMDGLLSRAGFAMTSKHIAGGVIGTYVCRKN